MTDSFLSIATETLGMAEQYLERAIPSLRELVQEFYSNPDAVSWAELEQLFEGLQWLNQMADSLQQQNMDVHAPIVEQIHTFGPMIPELERALEDQDHTLIADILNYDILQQLITLKHEIQQFMDSEATSHDISG